MIIDRFPQSCDSKFSIVMQQLNTRSRLAPPIKILRAMPAGGGAGSIIGTDAP